MTTGEIATDEIKVAVGTAGPSRGRDLATVKMWLGLVVGAVGVQLSVLLLFPLQIPPFAPLLALAAMAAHVALSVPALGGNRAVLSAVIPAALTVVINIALTLLAIVATDSSDDVLAGLWYLIVAMTAGLAIGYLAIGALLIPFLRKGAPRQPSTYSGSMSRIPVSSMLIHRVMPMSRRNGRS